MTNKELCEAQWQAPTLGSAINRVRWERDTVYVETEPGLLKRTYRLVAKAGTRRGKKK